MADADGRSSVPPLPPLPPLDENESQQPAQHFPTVGFSIAPGVSERASSIDRASNTPPQRILRNPSSANGDSLSSVTYNTTSPAVVPATAEWFNFIVRLRLASGDRGGRTDQHPPSQQS